LENRLSLDRKIHFANKKEDLVIVNPDDGADFLVVEGARNKGVPGRPIRALLGDIEMQLFKKSLKFSEDDF
jgi:hypothetical protein